MIIFADEIKLFAGGNLDAFIAQSSVTFMYMDKIE